MDKETLSNYGWIVICVLVLAVMIALATPFGNFIAGAVKSTTAGLFGVNQNALDAAGIAIGDNTFAEGEVTSVNHNGPTIPEGGTYYVCPSNGLAYVGDYSNATATYTSGDEFPAEPNVGDVYVYGDYEYRYKMAYNVVCYQDYIVNGWCARVLDNTKTTYGEIIDSINGKPIYMYGTFVNCKSLTTSPVIPSTVTHMGYTYFNCTSLTAAPEIPNTVIDMQQTFDGCINLTGTITINGTPNHHGNCLRGTQITEILGNCQEDVKTAILATK